MSEDAMTLTCDLVHWCNYSEKVGRGWDGIVVGSLLSLLPLPVSLKSRDPPTPVVKEM